MYSFHLLNVSYETHSVPEVFIPYLESDKIADGYTYTFLDEDREI